MLVSGSSVAHGDLGQLLRLDWQVALVTGAAQRIGREIARTFAEQGAQVLVTDIDDDTGERTVAEILESGGVASFAHADVGRSADIRAMIETAVARFGRLDILVNNAHWEKHATVVELDEADWDRSFAVLLKALFLGCKFAIPEMRKVGGGSIINIASVHAYHVSDAYVTHQTCNQRSRLPASCARQDRRTVPRPPSRLPPHGGHADDQRRRAAARCTAVPRA
jgi:NAD(P)-dependent dehydrogenase (short-subunit alcohol dehydrogenase family)